MYPPNKPRYTWLVPKYKKFRYLVLLRDSGEVNMYGASPLLAAKFNLSKEESQMVLARWMRTIERDEADQPNDGRSEHYTPEQATKLLEEYDVSVE
jgi:hypothetical protein